MSRQRKTVTYKNNYYDTRKLHQLMTTLAGDGYDVMLRCLGPRQWEFKVIIDNRSVFGVGAGPFIAAERCFWNWNRFGLTKEK
jgi:hypothetical protein